MAQPPRPQEEARALDAPGRPENLQIRVIVRKAVVQVGASIERRTHWAHDQESVQLASQQAKEEQEGARRITLPQDHQTTQKTDH